MPIDINFGALEHPNLFASFEQGQEAGDANRLKQARRAAFNIFSTDPEKASQILMSAGDLTGATALRKETQARQLQTSRTTATTQLGAGDTDAARKTALGAGDFDMAEAIGKMTDDQRKVANENAQRLGGYAMSLKAIPPEQRAARLQADAPFLQQLGFKPEQLAGFDPSDANLDQVASHAMDLKSALAQQNHTQDVQIRERQAKEAERNHRTMEGFAAKNAATSAFSAQTGRLSYEARKKGVGGFGTPGVGAVIGPSLTPDWQEDQ